MGDHVCLVCKEPAGLQCTACKTAYYCSREHSVSVRATPPFFPSRPGLTCHPQDWQKHKGQCKGIIALLFPMHEEKPRLVKVTYTLEVNKSTRAEVKTLDFAPWLPCKYRDHRQITSYGMFGRGRPLGRVLEMEFNDSYIQEESPLNQCVQAVTDKQAEPWGDNIIVFRRKGSNGYDDATMDDVEPMVAFFKDYNWRNLCVSSSNHSAVCTDVARTSSGYESPEAATELSVQMLPPSAFGF